MIEETRFLKLLTFVWYSLDRCHDLQLIEVNRFDKKSMKWQNSKFELKKYETFHGCQLVIGVEFEYPAFFTPDQVNNDSFSGYNLNLIKGLARHLNFTINFNPLLLNGTFEKNLTTDFNLV